MGSLQGHDPSAPSSRRLGRVLANKWKLDVVLGEGGSGSVYAATGPKGEHVAVKVLHEELAAIPEVRARFVREAYAANKVNHPGVVRIIEDGVEQEGMPYIVMELLEGETYEARQMRKGGTLPISEVLWVADRTLGVLTAAHAQGIVHRDIKPENLFLTHDRQLKVLDFGIARLSESRDTTLHGTVLGTLAFMPPEQARGATDEIGVQSDLWSVGATMFTLLSGKLVRDDQDWRKLLREAGSTRVPSLATVAPGTPQELVVLVDYALLLEIKVRWPTARMMRKALRLVHMQIQRDSVKQPVGQDEDEDDAEVPEPSFGLIAVQSIAPPPLSVGFPSEQLRLAAPPPPPPSAVAPTLIAPTSSTPAASTLHSLAIPPPPAPPIAIAPEPPLPSTDRETSPALTVKRPRAADERKRIALAVVAALAVVLLLTIVTMMVGR
jgi:serine/threonine-protein kinase